VGQSKKWQKISNKDVKDIRALAEPLLKLDSAKTAEMVAEMSDEMLEVFLSTTKETDRKEAIKKMWDVEEWVTRK
jgi:hypothetical protein